jgi:hypothetical protein
MQWPLMINPYCCITHHDGDIAMLLRAMHDDPAYRRWSREVKMVAQQACYWFEKISLLRRLCEEP